MDNSLNLQIMPYFVGYRSLTKGRGCGASLDFQMDKLDGCQCESSSKPVLQASSSTARSGISLDSFDG